MVLHRGGTTVSPAAKTQANSRLQPLKDSNLRNREADESDRLPISFYIQNLVILSEANHPCNGLPLADAVFFAALRTTRNQRNSIWQYVGTDSP